MSFRGRSTGTRGRVTGPVPISSTLPGAPLDGRPGDDPGCSGIRESVAAQAPGRLTDPMETSVEALEEGKVRLHVAVPAAEFERAVDAAFRKLARSVRIPGFRPGKAPRRLLEARLGSEAGRDQALRDALPDYYAEAVTAEQLDTIAPPEIDLTAGEDDGDVEFDAVVQVRPVVTVDGYDSLRVRIDDPAVTDDAVEAQVDALRERFADLEDSTAPLADGHYALIDVTGTQGDERIDGLSVDDFLCEVGSDVLVPELDAELRGRGPGDILAFDAVLPERFGDRAGETVSFRVLVKETKRKVLPEATDEWVSEVSEFDTLEAFRAETRRRMEVMALIQAQVARRDAVLAELAGLVELDPPGVLVDEEMQRRIHDLGHQLEARGATIAQYLAATGADEESFVATIRETAVRAVRTDLALRAIVAQEGIEVADDELAAEIERLAQRMGQKPAAVRRDLERRGAVEAVRSDMARAKALEHVVDRSEAVDEEGNVLDLTLPADLGAPPAGDAGGPGAEGSEALPPAAAGAGDGDEENEENEE